MLADGDKRKRSALNPIFAALALVVLALAVDILFPKIFSKVESGDKAGCIANLRLIEQAKRDWAAQTQAPSNAVPTWEDLRGILGKLGINTHAYPPNCPDGGIYTIGSLTNAPTCSIKGHALN